MKKLNQQSVAKEIAAYRKVGQTGFWLTTDEEARAIALAREAFPSVHTYKWTPAAGLFNMSAPEEHLIPVNDRPDMMLWAALEHVTSTRKLVQIPWVLFIIDPEVAWEKRPQAMRVLQEALVHPWVQEHGTFVVISRQECPTPLKPLLVDFELSKPSVQDLAEALQAIDIDDGDARLLAEASVGLTLEQAVTEVRRHFKPRAVSQSVAALWESKVARLKALGMRIEKPNISWESVGGLYELKRWFEERVKTFKPEARSAGVPGPRGILLVGPAGVGKSLFGRAVASKLGIPYIEVDFGALYGPFVGQTEAAARQFFQTIDLHSPAVLYCDEIAHQLSGYESSGVTDPGVVARVVQGLLTWLEDRPDGIVFVGSTNEPWRLPPHFNRAGRIDATWCVHLPGADELEEILEIHIKARKSFIEADIDTKKLAVQMAEMRFSGAEAEQTIVEATQATWPRKADQTALTSTMRQIVPQAEADRERYVRIVEWGRSRARQANRLSG